jgi:dihydroneopterin aldolase
MIVFIERLRISGPIGWYEAERKEGVELFVSLSVNFSSSLYTDNLIETIDYLKIAEIVQAVSNNEYKLLETLASDIAKEIDIFYSNFKIKQIKIKIEKELQHKIGLQLNYVGIEEEFNYPI